MTAGDAKHRVGPALAVLSLGATALLGQVVLVREVLVVFSGNELVLGALFALWLAGIACGAALGTPLARRSRRPETAVAAILVLVGPVLAAQIVIVRHLRGWLGPEPGALLPLVDLLLASPAVVLPLPVLIGLAFPPACRLREGRGDVDAAGTTYVLEAIGSLVAGLVFTFVLAGRLPSPATAALAILVAASGATAQLAARGAGRIPIAAAAGVATLGAVVLVSPIAARLDRATVEQRWENLAGGRRLVESVETPYGVVEVGERQGQHDLFVSGAYASSFPDPWSSGPPAHLALLAHPAPRRALVVGGGADGLLQAMLRHPDLESLEHAETDPAIAALVRRHLPGELAAGLEDPRLTTRGRDGRRVVRAARAAWDVVLVSAPEPSSALGNRVSTREFLLEVRSALRRGGVLAMRFPVPAAYARGEEGALAATVHRTIGSVFGHTLVLPFDGECLFLGTDRPGILTLDACELGRRYATARAADPAFVPDGVDPALVLGDLVRPDRARELRSELAGMPAETNSDGRPAAVLRALVLFERFSGGGSADAFRRIVDLPPIVLPGTVVAVTLILAGVVVWRRRAGGGAAVSAGAAVATAGFAAMALELALLLQLQSSLGHVYGVVGGVVGLFMAGLAAGGSLGARLGRRVPSARRTLMLLLLAVVSTTAAAPVLLPAAGGLPGHLALVAFLLLAALSGLVTGPVFPVAVAYRLRAGGDLAGAAGGVDASDHVGAALGALVTGVLLLPLAGLVGACLAAAALAGAGLLAVHLGPEGC